MAKRCTHCGKSPQVGHLISHSNIKTLRRFEPNIVKKKIFDPIEKKMIRQKLCTACLRTMTKATHVKRAATTARKLAGATK